MADQSAQPGGSNPLRELALAAVAVLVLLGTFVFTVRKARKRKYGRL